MKRIYLVRLLLSCSVIIIAFHIYNTSGMFANRGVEQLIREQIGKPHGPITPEDCRGITELHLSMSDLNNNLKGLELFVDLKKLTSNAGNITDISALRELNNLEELSLMKNKVKDISPLSKLTNLRSLDLYDNRIRDISPLATLTKLEVLQIGKNPVVDMSPLEQISGLYIDINFYG